MGIHFRKSKRFGTRHLHIKLNVSRTGLSWSFQIGPLSYNTRAKKWRLDLPGGLHYIFGGR